MNPAYVNSLMRGAGPNPPKPLFPRSPAVPGPVEFHPSARCVCGCLAGADHDNGGWCRTDGCGCSYVELVPMKAAS